jgi:hypothetical protein
VQANKEAQKGLNAEFDRRGGWTRAFLVTNGNGHVHSSMHCSTCNRGLHATQFQWMTDWSAKDEAEIVEAAGWRACTVCYPSAPVGDEKSLPTKMFSDADKSKAEAKAEREAAKAARDAKTKAAAPTASGEPLRVLTEVYTPTHGPRAGQPQNRFETFKTERTAIMWATERFYYNGPSGTEWAAINAIANAVAEKRGVDARTVLDEIVAKGKKKAAK